MAEINFSRSKTLEEALRGDPNTVYFTNDTRDIVMNGDSYSTRRVFNTSLVVSHIEDEYTATVSGVDDLREPGEYYCYSGSPADSTNVSCFRCVITWEGTGYVQTIYPLVTFEGLNPATDYIYRTAYVSNSGTTFSDWVVKKDDHNIYWQS